MIKKGSDLMKKIYISNQEFITIDENNINICFTTNYNNVNYKFDTNEGKLNLQNLKNIFNITDVCYLKQTHSDKVIEVKEHKFNGDIEGDAIICNKSNIAIGVFTADCVPILLYDKENNVVAAVHSGWKGTFDNIVANTLTIMKEKYECKEIYAVIYPHIRDCCYEVSQELVDKFNDKYGDKYITNSRKLSMEAYIKIQLKEFISENNIISLNFCTLCSKEPEFHSYRKLGDKAGRLFSFIFID